MPRKARIDAPGALHHVIVRGIERSPIFIGEPDREDFLQRAKGVFRTHSRGRPLFVTG